MSVLRRIITEIHRRSLWQVLSIYLVGSWVALQVVDSLTRSAGLPDWVPAFALVLLILGLPMCLATAFVQEGMGSGGREDEVTDPADAGEAGPTTVGASAPATSGKGASPTAGVSASSGGEPGDAVTEGGRATAAEPPRQPGLLRTLFTWKNALVGGVLAFVLLAVAVVAYFTMWSAGIGPMGSLVAQGVLDERDRIVLADFANATPDSLLGGVVTEALRVDLLESRVLTVVDPSLTRQVLRRMQRDPSTRLTARVAREVAQRGGLKAVIQGEVGSAGEGYVLTARLVEAESGRTLAAFRETADDDGELIGAIDKLSQNIREKAGESLRSIKGGEPLETVTTSSLEALRKYSQALRLEARGELERGIDVLEEAVAEDSTFAMAWRKLGVYLDNVGRGGPKVDSAVTRAYRLRNRLSDSERYATVAYYHHVVTDSADQAERAYRNLLDVDPDNAIALNNLALILRGQDEEAEALELLDRAVDGPGESSVAHLNRIMALAALDSLEAARAAAELYMERYPEDYRSVWQAVRLSLVREEWEEGKRLAEEGLERFGIDLARRDFRLLLAEIAVARGRLDAAEDHYDRVIEEHELEVAEDVVEDLALAEAILGDPRQALERLTGAYEPGGPLAELPEEDWGWGALTALHARAGDEAGTDETLERGLGYEPDFTEEDVRRERARLEGLLAMARGRWEAAVAHLKEFRRLSDCEHCLLPELGIAYMEAGRTDQAIPTMERWLDENEWGLHEAAIDPLLLERLGRLYEEEGDTSKAVDAYTRFAERWEDADPRFQPRVEAARRSLQRLTAVAGEGR